MQASGVVRLAWSWRLGLWRGAGAGGGSARAPAFCGISACTGDGCAVGPRRVCVHGNFCKRRLRQHGRVLCPSGLRVHGVCSYSVRGSFGSGFERFAFGRQHKSRSFREISAAAPMSCAAPMSRAGAKHMTIKLIGKLIVDIEVNLTTHNTTRQIS